MIILWLIDSHLTDDFTVNLISDEFLQIFFQTSGATVNLMDFNFQLLCEVSREESESL